MLVHLIDIELLGGHSLLILSISQCQDTEGPTLVRVNVLMMHLLEEGTGLSLLAIDELLGIVLELEIPVLSDLVLDPRGPTPSHLSLPQKLAALQVVLLDLGELRIEAR